MKILVIKSSPNLNGSSNLIADRFIQGVCEAGHEVSQCNTSKSDIHPCTGCRSGPCCQHDDMDLLREQILEKDVLVFVTPVYYFGMSAQLKTFIDRLYCIDKPLSEKHVKSLFICSCGSNNESVIEPLKAQYKAIAEYLNFEDKGFIGSLGCVTPEMTAATEFPEKAYKLGTKM